MTPLLWVIFIRRNPPFPRPIAKSTSLPPSLKDSPPLHHKIIIISTCQNQTTKKQPPPNRFDCEIPDGLRESGVVRRGMGEVGKGDFHEPGLDVVDGFFEYILRKNGKEEKRKRGKEEKRKRGKEEKRKRGKEEKRKKTNGEKKPQMNPHPLQKHSIIALDPALQI